MHFSLPLLAALLGSAAAQNTMVSNLAQIISVSGGFGGQSSCNVALTLDRGNNPINVRLADTCDKFQRDGITNGMWWDVPNTPGVQVKVSCDVQSGDCGHFFDVEVRGDDGYCNSGKSAIKDCPTSGFKRNAPGRLGARQDSPVDTAPTQCYDDITLSGC